MVSMEWDNPMNVSNTENIEVYDDCINTEYLEMDILNDECNYTNTVEWIAPEDISIGGNSPVDIAQEKSAEAFVIDSDQKDKQAEPEERSNSEMLTIYKISPIYHACTICRKLRSCSYSFKDQETKYLCTEVCLKQFTLPGTPINGKESKQSSKQSKTRCVVCSMMTVRTIEVKISKNVWHRICSEKCLQAFEIANNMTLGQKTLSDESKLSRRNTNQAKENSSNTVIKSVTRGIFKENNGSTIPNNYGSSRIKRLLMQLHPQFSKRVQVNLIRIHKTEAWRKHYRRKRINVRLAGLYNAPQKLRVLGTQKYIRKKEKNKSNNNTDVKTTQRLSGQNKNLSNKSETETYISEALGKEIEFVETDKETTPKDPLAISWDNIYDLQILQPCGATRPERVVKKVELAGIDEIRRINKTILTAQVSPISVHNQQKDKNVVSPFIEKCNNNKVTSKSKPNMPNDDDIELIGVTPSQYHHNLLSQKHFHTGNPVTDTVNASQKSKSKENVTLEKPIEATIQDLDDILQCTIIKKPLATGTRNKVPETDTQTQPYLVTANEELVSNDSDLSPKIIGVCSLADPVAVEKNNASANVQPKINTVNPNGAHPVLNASADCTFQSPIQNRGEGLPNQLYTAELAILTPILISPNNKTITPLLSSRKLPPTYTAPINTAPVNLPSVDTDRGHLGLPPPLVPAVLPPNSLLILPTFIPVTQLTATPSNTNSFPVLFNTLNTTESQCVTMQPSLHNISQTSSGKLINEEMQCVAGRPIVERSSLSSSFITSESCRVALRTGGNIIRLDSSKPLWKPANDFLVLTEQLLPCRLPTYWTLTDPPAQIIWPCKDSTIQENHSDYTSIYEQSKEKQLFNNNTHEKQNDISNSNKVVKTSRIKKIYPKSKKSGSNPVSMIKVKSFAKVDKSDDTTQGDIIEQCNKYFKKISDDPLHYASLLSVVTSTEECDSLIREGAALYVLSRESCNIEALHVQEMPRNFKYDNALLVRHTDSSFIKGMASMFQDLYTTNPHIQNDQVYLFTIKKPGNSTVSDLEFDWKSRTVRIQSTEEIN